MYIKLTQEEKDARKEARRAAKKLETLTAEKNQKPVKSITISIEWKKSRMWGHNPHASAKVIYQDGTHGYIDGITCSGCGYCKESTVIAEIFNQLLKYKLHAIGTKKEHPYGMYLREDWKCYNGGVGTECYYKISEFIGGSFKHTASGKSFDVYEYIAL